LVYRPPAGALSADIAGEQQAFDARTVAQP
jgi:hypothetical protein